MKSMLKKEKHKIGLGEHFTYGRLLRFALPSVIMMIFTSVYGVVDGLFISNFVGKTAFAAVNLIMPVSIALGACGFMVGAGGSAIVAKTLGEGDEKRAKEYFTMLVVFAVILGVSLTVIGQIALEPVARALGATDEMMPHCLTYGRVMLSSLTFFLLQNVFQNLLVTAEKPKVGLAVIVAAGCTNIALDALFVAVFNWGVMGAAVATALSQVIGGGLPLIYFSRKNGGLLRFTRFRFHGKILAKTCTNGSSELMTNLSLSVLNMVYNGQLMALAGENGVAAYGAIMYLSFVFISIFIGYSVGSAPIISFNYGAQRHAELKNLLRKSLTMVACAGAALAAIGMVFAPVVAGIFVGYDQELLALTSYGMRLYSISFLFSGFNIFGSAFFTALNNGLISALISFLRTLLFQVGAVLLLPMLFGLNGIWFAVSVAELMTLAFTVTFILTQRKKYDY